MMMFMATMMIMIIVMIFYIWFQWFCSLKNHERYRYLWRKIMKDINIYDATGIERVMKRLSIDIASVFSKLIASLWCYCVMRKHSISAGMILSSKYGSSPRVFLCLASGRLLSPEAIFGGGCIPSVSYVKLKPSKGY